MLRRFRPQVPSPMSHLPRAAAALALAASLLAAPSAAARGPTGFALAAGAFDVGKSGTAGQAGASLRWPSFDLPLGSLRLPIEPATGLFVTGDEAVYGYLSFRLDLSRALADWPWEQWRAVPFTGVGLYERGDGKNLGGAVEFRSGLEVARRLGRAGWLGLSYAHLSNAGLYDVNPGEESLVLVWSSR